jgi:hypothetical protein
MIVVAGVLLMLAAAILLSRLARRSDLVQVQTCCSARPWPPHDLVDSDGARSTSA